MIYEALYNEHTLATLCRSAVVLDVLNKPKALLLRP